MIDMDWERGCTSLLFCEIKEMEIIKQIYFEDFTSLACEISDNFDMVKDEFGDIAIIAKYEEAKEIIAELVCIGHSLVSIRMSRPEWDGYCDEYIISLNHDGIWCEPMKMNGKYITDESTMIYIFDNCSSAVIPQCKGNILLEVGIADEEEFDCDECYGCCECSNELTIESDDNMHGFTVNRSDENSYYSYSFYSTDMGLVEQMAKMFK